ncbi:MAG: glutamine-hydrolyzing GMP synthase [Candidatus Lightella neohaematopini]|nr:glutamine-hydrolyzing GMP synthase [Candidatus Lightella neohaematopini]MCV2528989.1 glutamine-hydrolyzing GMP synthase [Candidatus Lightella neohaematopini]
MKNNNCIIIIDFNSQYTMLIFKILRKLKVYCEIYDCNNISVNKIYNINPNGIILSGSSHSVLNNGPMLSNKILNINIPILGICYGMQLIVKILGGNVENIINCREFGLSRIVIKNYSKLTNNIYDRVSNNGFEFLDVWMSHNDVVTKIPDGFTVIAGNDKCKNAIIADEKNKIYGLQFHPEVSHTKCGISLIKRFIFNICNCIPDWNINNINNTIISSINNLVKNNDKVILGLSGGIDSLVTAIIINSIIGKRLICIFIDNGLLRLDEYKLVTLVSKNFNLNTIFINAKNRFFYALSNIDDAEEKRKIIGKIFIDIFLEQSTNFSNVKWLAQGTIYSDIIESKNKIKSHHNVGGLPSNITLKLLEPIKKLFKDEVRKLGLKMNIPYNILYRYPFPGPGLAIRIIGKVNANLCKLLRLADNIFIEELKNSNFYYRIDQAFTVLLPIKSVGIIGDCRRYDLVLSLRAINTSDFMTAKWVKIPYNLLHKISNRILNEINEISRVVYDISDKPPSTIEWE